MSKVRLIDANALKEKWLFRGEDGKPYRDEIDNAPTIEPTVDKDYLIRLIQEAVYDGEACARLMDMVEPKWIPCEERLPEAEYGESDSVLATCKHKDEDEPRWIRLLYFNGGNWCYPTGEVYTSEVIAWMPLPEPCMRGEKNNG